MKLERQSLDRFLKSPAENVAAVLIYGPDEGMVHERANLMTRAILGEADDPFRLVELSGDDLKADGARLSDEARAIAMMGGRRVIRVSRVTDALEPVFAALLEEHRDSALALVVVEAGDVGSRSSLKKLFEGIDHAGAVACYRDEAAALPAIIGQQVKEAGLEIERDALSYLAANLGGDRGVTRSEIDKLILYMGAEKRIALKDAEACVADQAAIGLDDLCQAVGLGELKSLERQLERNLAETHPIMLVKMVSRHFLRLHQVIARLQRGEPLDAAMNSLQPRVFWKAVDGFKLQCRRWQAGAIANALLRLAELEAEAMRHHQFADTLIRRGLMEVATLANRK
ncbi:DNA polymerase III subunit delta [Dongia sp.]|uniref:DNA polymerase III subunit delta n=1 Tax=Dongia sp. TaxID=1977262 RepID=UPI0035B4B5EF